MDLINYLRTQWDRVGGVLAVILGAVLLFVGWQGVHDTAYPAEQIPYLISGGLGGLLLIGVGAILWISADLRDEWRRIESLEHTIERHAALLESASEAPAVAPEPKPVRRSRASRPREPQG
jgi:hypothetical protein